MQIRYVAIDQLQPHPGNARTHSKKQVRQIARSVERFGFNNPVLIDRDKKIIAGHGRVAAARLLGMNEIPTVEISHLNDTDKRAYILADNKHALNAGWDRNILAIELQGLTDLNYEVDLTGFAVPEVELILDQSRRIEPVEDAEDRIPETAAVAISRIGDVWLLGQHVLLCGSALAQSAYDAVLGGERAVQVFSTPTVQIPPEQQILETDRGPGQVLGQDLAPATIDDQRFRSSLGTALRLLADNTVDGSIHHLCIDWWHSPAMMDAGRKVYTELKGICVWNKPHAGSGSFYRSKHELVFVWKHGTAPRIRTPEPSQRPRQRTDIWDHSGSGACQPNDERWPTHEKAAAHVLTDAAAKPVALVADALSDCSHRGDLVLDPFCGAGSTLIAAERIDRGARLIECDPTLVDVAIRRWQSQSGMPARLQGTQQTFEQVAEQRTTAAD